MPSADFILLGAPACGVPTLARWLAEHPDVALPSRQDSLVRPPPDRERRRGAPGGAAIPAVPGPDPAEDASGLPGAGRVPGEDAHRLPPDGLWAPGETRKRADVSEWYLASGTALAAIRATAPEARLVVCLDDPAEMAWRLHAENLRTGREQVRDFHAAWALSYARRRARGVRAPEDAVRLDYAGLCSLGAQLARLLAQVPPRQVHVVFREDLRDRPSETWTELLAFLDLPRDSRDTFALEETPIAPGEGRLHDWLAGLRAWKRAAIQGLRTALPVGGLLNGTGGRPGGPLRPLPRHVRQDVSDRLSDDIATLSVLTGRDLAHWIA